MKKIILILTVMILLTSIAFAVTQSLPDQKQNTCISLPQLCANCTYVNITSVQYPNSTIEYINKNMTKQGGQYNYSFCNTSQLGKYIVNTQADGLDYPYDFNVTATGAENSLTFFILFAAVSLVILLLAFIFKNNIFAIISGFCFMGTGVYGMIYGFGDFTNLYTRILSYIIIGIGAIITLTASYDIITESEGGGSNDESYE